MFECKYGLNENLCDSKQKWNLDESWCECEKLDHWNSYKEDYIWSTSTCDFVFKKACKFDNYRKRLYGKIAWALEDKILNLTENLLFDKKLTFEKQYLPYLHYFTSNYFNFISLLLIFTSISYYY